MRAVILTGKRDAPCVEVADIDAPNDAPGRIVIAVISAGITRMEPRWRTSWQNADGTPRKLPITLGLEFAGRVRSLGHGVHGIAVGQNVMGMADPFRGGALAEFVSVETGRVLPIPDGVAYEASSTLPLAGQTAWQALVRYGELGCGQRVLIHGGAGGVGTFAVQIARWIGAYIVVTAAAKDADLCKNLGADEVIDFAHERFEDRGEKYDLVFDQIGGEVQERSWTVLKRGGRLITIAGEKADAPDQERARALGVSARFFIVDNNPDELRHLTNLVRTGTVRPIIGKRYDLSEAAAAFDDPTDRFVGKTVSTCFEPSQWSRV